MIVIGERINGMFTVVKNAIKDQDKKPIQELAEKQVKAGADMLDLNVGTASAEPEQAMKWLVLTVQEVTKKRLSIDCPKIAVVEAGLGASKNPTLINSTTGKQSDMDRFYPLAKKHGAAVIGLTIDEAGVPNDLDKRNEIAMKHLAKAMEVGLPAEDLFIDPIIMQVKFAQAQCGNVLQAIRAFKTLSDPPPQVVVGLSNVSSKASRRELINRTYLAMCIGMGLDAAILDPNDTELMETMITAELLLNKSIYCDSFVEAYYNR